MMRLHASTRERLPYLDAFYQQTLAPIGEIHSLLDLASVESSDRALASTG